ncbi:hypothetical protein QBC34DRAFT_424561 [Podospora aff. communis PSN243]|uniref:AA1-like domain-containing protein n=1 Tax=Podospora aff. communis PSN243 TaxID=3040156 RepID=A0AAV9GPZ6_9PEZI|nr:hypothetical protein QBC34DRAFT_424561 [Podospora aff. communis PSN243]
MRLLPLSLLTLAPSLVLTQETSCALPSWTISSVNLSFRNPTQANFTLTNTVTKVTEDISCRLEFATLCEIRGTPADKDLYIHLQERNGDHVWFNVTVPYTCDGRAGQVTGIGEQLIECPDDYYKCATTEPLDVVGSFIGW